MTDDAFWLTCANCGESGYLLDHIDAFTGYTCAPRGASPRPQRPLAGSGATPRTGASIEIERFWYERGDAGPRFHSTFVAHGLAGVVLRVCVFVYFSTRVPVTNSGDPRYITPDGHLTVQEEATPAYEHSRFRDVVQTIPFNQFIAGRHDYTAALAIQAGAETMARAELENGFWVDRA